MIANSKEPFLFPDSIAPNQADSAIEEGKPFQAGGSTASPCPPWRGALVHFRSLVLQQREVVRRWQIVESHGGIHRSLG